MSVNREELTGLKESFWTEPKIKEAVATKKELAAAAERTKSAMSFLRKIHKATEAAALEDVMNAIEKAATKGDIDDKQETRLKDAWNRKKDGLANNPTATEPTATEEEEVKADETEAPVEETKIEEKEKKEYQVEITNTWRVTVDASSEADARKQVLAMSMEGYDVADDYDGPEILDVEETGH